MRHVPVSTLNNENPQSSEHPPHALRNYVKKNSMPFCTIDFSDKGDKARHDRMVSMVKNMLTWNKQLAAAKTPQEETVLERQIAATDRRIDQLVYELYGLTEEEINLIEAG